MHHLSNKDILMNIYISKVFFFLSLEYFETNRLCVLLY